MTGSTAIAAGRESETPPVHSVSWNLTRRCHLRCDHCYIEGAPGPRGPDELTTAECLRVMDGIAEVNPGALLILTGGEPLLRPDLPALAAEARRRGFTVVVGTSGVLLTARAARGLRGAGVQGVGLSLDSTDPARHDAFRRLPGAWQGAVLAAGACRAEGLDFSLHMTVTDWNADEIPAMTDLAGELGARVLNLFFLVRCGRAEGLADLPAVRFEAILDRLVARELGDGQPGRVPVRAKCAPQYRRLVWQRDPRSPLLASYAEGSCPAGRHYCRITPEGAVTPSPYLPLPVGDLRERSFAEIWRTAPVFRDLRAGRLGGRCGRCEFARICGGCRCRAYATHRDYLAEDPACPHEPDPHAGAPVEIPAVLTFGLAVVRELPWSEAASARLAAIPSFARGMVVRAVEAHARATGRPDVTPELMAEVRRQWGGRFAPRSAP